MNFSSRRVVGERGFCGVRILAEGISLPAPFNSRCPPVGAARLVNTSITRRRNYFCDAICNALRMIAESEI